MRYRREAHAPHAAEYGHDLGVAALAHYAVATWHLGYPAQAAETTRRAIELAAAVEHANTATYAYFFPAGLVAASARDMPALDRASRKLGELSRQHGLAQWAALGTALRGCCLALGGGEAAEAVGTIQDGLLACRSVGFEIYRPLFLGYLAEALLRAGDAKGAARAASQELSLVEDTGERADEPELLRLAGRIAAARAPAGTARRHRPRPTLARAGQAQRGTRSLGTGPRVVHRRLRHARPERGQRAARRAASVIETADPTFRTGSQLDLGHLTKPQTKSRT
jgi:hypothetical protein